MRKFVPFVLFVILSFAPLAHAEIRPEPRTLFDYAERSWAVGVISLGKPLEFRGGEILAFPSQIDELVWAPNGTKPRNLMLVYEVQSNEKDNPAFHQNDVILAPIQLLPEHSYWKDNLPNTRRHAIAGGRRYAFRGDEIAEVKKILADYLAAFDKHSEDRWKGELRAVVGALGTKVARVREDAATFIAGFPSLQRDFEDADVAGVAAYLGGDAPPSEKLSVIDALATANISSIKPALTELAKRDDATGAAALHGLDRLGAAPTTDQLLALTKSKSIEIQAYAAEALGRRSASDDAAFKRSQELFVEMENPTVMTAAAAGLGTAGGDRVTDFLGTALGRGDATSQPAAEALAAIGTPPANAILIKTLKEKKGRAAGAAIDGMRLTENCADCQAALLDAYKNHPDEEIRKTAGIVLEVPLQHKH